MVIKAQVNITFFVPFSLLLVIFTAKKSIQKVCSSPSFTFKSFLNDTEPVY